MSDLDSLKKPYRVIFADGAYRVVQALSSGFAKDQACEDQRRAGRPAVVVKCEAVK